MTLEDLLIELPDNAYIPHEVEREIHDELVREVIIQSRSDYFSERGI